ncbi:hypothetical protein [Nocardioides sp. CFH 31398]|uniref:hypothetical protein n=1 Tax=Nocardioides sp. CFH 31398 TaxID=2919579 RepID=UPI001F061574|nr:hypothetical protein [Nocardioides sp. CFH 31398]MCH1865558.1 hypothetical protein [Nocardioides sp. CFH 31398]
MTRRSGPAAPVLVAALLLTACSGGGGPSGGGGAGPDAAASSDEPALSAPELEGGGADGGTGGTGGAPTFDGERELTISAARRTAVDEPCTANQIERLCGSSTTFQVRPVGPPRRVILVSASTRPEATGLTWRVRLAFAPDGAPLPLPTRGDDQVLTDDEGLQVVVTPTARLAGRSITLRGLPKRQAWLTVEQLAGEA